MRNGGLIATLATGIVAAALASPANAQQASFNIPAGSLQSALHDYGRQSGRPIIYKADEVRGLRSPGYRGAASPTQALDAILSGTGFLARTSASGAVAVVRMRTSASEAATLVRARMEQNIGVVAPSSDAGAEDAGVAQPSEIIVTATKRSERLQDVPMSITAATGEQLIKQGVTNAADLTKVVPGFAYQASNTGAPVYYIRGVGFFDNSLTSAPTVSLYVDQSPLPISIMSRGATLDLERVEVLKGPQGTLFGQNSTGGAINFIAAKPTHSFKAGLDLGYGRFNEVIAGGFVSGPISDTLRARLALRTEHMDGWQKSQTRPGDTLGTKRFYNGRLLLDWTPSDTLSIQANLSAWQDRSDDAAYQNINVTAANPILNDVTGPVFHALQAAPLAPAKPRAADWDAGEDLRRNDKFYSGSLRADWSLSDDITLTSLTAYSHITVDRPYDFDGTAVRDLPTTLTALGKSFSQELRLGGTSGPLQWMVGGYYQNATLNETIHVFHRTTANAVGPFAYAGLDITNNQQPTTWAAFGSLDYEVTDQVTLRASGRYTDEKRKFNGCLRDAGQVATGDGYIPIRDVFGGLPTLFGGMATVIPPFGCMTLDDTGANPTFAPVLVRDTLKEDNFSFRASVDWKPNSGTLLYLTVAQGYKAGSYSIPPAVLASMFSPATQEKLLSYEGGFKLSLADRKVQLNGAAFYYDYDDKQLTGVTRIPIFGFLPKQINIPKSRLWGAEIEAVITPIDGLRVTGGITYVNSKVETDPINPLDALGVPTTFVGEAFPNTPKWQGTGDGEYGFPVGDRMNLFVGGTMTYRGKTYALFGETPSFRLPAYTLIDLRAGVESRDGAWRIQAYARNITNKYYWVNVTKFGDNTTRTPAMGATYGVLLTYRY